MKTLRPERMPFSVGGGVCRIPLTKGRFALIDEADLEVVAGRHWFVTGRYPAGHFNVNGRRGVRYLHRVISDAPEGVCVDHINGDKFDSRRVNLRLCNHAQNNAAVERKVGALGFRGVAQQVVRGAFHARISVSGKTVYIGSYPTAEEAARAYDAAAMEHYGEFAVLNFPCQDRPSDHLIVLPVHARRTPQSEGSKVRQADAAVSRTINPEIRRSA